MEKHAPSTTSKVLAIVMVVLAVAIVALGIFLTLSGAALGDIRGFGPAHLDGHRGFGYGAPGFGPRHFGLPLLPIGLLVLFLVLVSRAKRRWYFRRGSGLPLGKGLWRHGGLASGESALEVLRTELAEGRVSIEEFTARKRVLEEGESDRNGGGA